MKRLLFSSLVALSVMGSAGAQTPGQDQQSPFYPAPPPEQAPKVEQGAPLQGLSSPLASGEQKISRTVVDSDAEAQLFAGAVKIVWGRYAKLKGAKPGAVEVTRQGALWIVKGRIDSVAAGSEGDWASIDGVVERITAGNVVVRGEVAFRIAKVQKGTPCKVAGSLHFKRSGKSQVWRLVEGDNPCDGAQEMFDLVYEKPVEKKPVPAAGAPKRT
jgi:hypothetical protein